MIRLLAVVFALMLLSSPGSLEAEALQIPTVTVAGEGLPGEVQLSLPEADAFRRRINLPPRIESPEESGGPTYVVTSDYWETVLFDEEIDRDPEALSQGTYYPRHGYVRVPLDEEDAWLVLDLRQRTILNRNIRLAQEGLMSTTPSSIDMLNGALQSETIGVEVGAQLVDEETSRTIFEALSSANPAPFLEPRVPLAAGGGSGFWLVVTMPEGYALRYYYDGASTVYEALGTERYDATSIAPLLDAIAPATPLVIEQQDPVGGLFWWPLTIGGGLALIGLAVWFRRRFPTAG